MGIKELVKEWFDKWEEGNFRELPIANNFKHTSPYGTVNGKKQYLGLVESNQDKFLGHRLEIHDALYGEDKACIRYTAIQGDFTLEVSEWHFVGKGKIEEIIAYYHVEEERIKIP